jgi:hypothetical protein
VPLLVYGGFQEVLNAIGAKPDAGSYLVDRLSVLLR